MLSSGGGEYRSTFFDTDTDDMLVRYGSLGDLLRLTNVGDEAKSASDVSERTLSGNESIRSFLTFTGDVVSGLKAKDRGGQAETEDGDVL